MLGNSPSPLGVILDQCVPEPILSDAHSRVSRYKTRAPLNGDAQMRRVSCPQKNGRTKGPRARAPLTSRTMLLIIFLISVLSVLGPEGQSPSATLRPPATENSGQCSAACESRQQSKLLRLYSIHSQVLSALRLERAPNLTRDAARQLVPRAPPLLELLSRYERHNGSTGEDYEEAEEREEASTETIITMATERKRT